jgi:hypothetical protein
MLRSNDTFVNIRKRLAILFVVRRRMDRKDDLVVDIDFDSWQLAGVESKCYVVQSWRHENDGRLVFLPEEVVRASIDSLDFPWNLTRVVKVACLPYPPASAVLCTECLIDKRLVVKRILEPLLFAQVVHFTLN